MADNDGTLEHIALAHSRNLAQQRARGRPKWPRRQNLKLMTWAVEHLKDIFIASEPHVATLMKTLINLWSRPFQQIAQRLQGRTTWKSKKAAFSGILQDLVRTAQQAASRRGPDLVKEVACLLSGKYSFEKVAEHFEWDPSVEEVSAAGAAQSFAHQLSTTSDLSTIPRPEEDRLVPLAYATWLAKLRVTVFACVLDSSRIPTTTRIWQQSHGELNAVLPGLADKLDEWWYTFCRQNTAQRYANSSVAARLAWNRWQVELRARVMEARGKGALRDVETHKCRIAAAAEIILQQTPSATLTAYFEDPERDQKILPSSDRLDGGSSDTAELTNPSHYFPLPAQSDLLHPAYHATSASPFDFNSLSSHMPEPWLGGTPNEQALPSTGPLGSEHSWDNFPMEPLANDVNQPFPLASTHHSFPSHPFGKPLGFRHMGYVQPTTIHSGTDLEAFPQPPQPTARPAHHAEPVSTGLFHTAPAVHEWSQSRPTFGYSPPSSSTPWPPRPRLALGHRPVIARRIARGVYGLDADEWSRGKSWPAVESG